MPTTESPSTASPRTREGDTCIRTVSHAYEPYFTAIVRVLVTGSEELNLRHTFPYFVHSFLKLNLSC